MKYLHTIIQVKDTNVYILTGSFLNNELKVLYKSKYKLNGDHKNGFDNTIMVAYLIEKHMKINNIKKTSLVFLLTDSIAKIDYKELPLHSSTEIEKYLNCVSELSEDNQISGYVYEIINGISYISLATIKQNTLINLNEIANEVKQKICTVDLEENAIRKAIWPMGSDREGIVFILRSDGLHIFSYNKGIPVNSYWLKDNVLEHREEDKESYNSLVAEFFKQDILQHEYADSLILLKILDKIHKLFSEAYKYIRDNDLSNADIYYINEMFSSEVLKRKLEEYCKLSFMDEIRLIGGNPLNERDNVYLTLIGGLLNE
ncbi:MAG: hypothetical protein GXZ11_01065 [Tissierellia bacterium]|nr:hypothetical protein [Tissierellia bacterium]